MTWNFCFWKRETFLASYEAEGHGVFSGRVGLHPIDKLKAVKVSEESDLRLAEALLRQRSAPSEPPAFWEGLGPER